MALRSYGSDTLAGEKSFIYGSSPTNVVVIIISYKSHYFLLYKSRYISINACMHVCCMQFIACYSSANRSMVVTTSETQNRLVD